ncbi:MAG: hypothetical protein HQM08_10620 [Candidatus Riflebacteria bacterium]|nr:hypothetical protein [Candidatus Riflebacteria bacterium]
MADCADCPEVTLEQLKKMSLIHRRELRWLEKMSETQFQAFKKNFSICGLEGITRDEALGLIKSMLFLNLKLQSEFDQEKG